jgi:hypothetical protein
MRSFKHINPILLSIKREIAKPGSRGSGVKQPVQICDMTMAVVLNGMGIS